jgi:hypothetical protein
MRRGTSLVIALATSLGCGLEGDPGQVEVITSALSASSPGDRSALALRSDGRGKGMATPLVLFRMTLTLRGHIENGRIVVDEGVDLPDGTEVKLTLVDDVDELDEEDRARLHAALEQAQDEIDRGEGIPASEVIAELRKPAR